MSLPAGISVTTDVVFRYVFSSSGSEKGLRGFINAIQQSSHRPEVEQIEILNPFNLPKIREGKETILDLRARDVNGRQYDIEMQAINKVAFLNRILYYWSRLYSDQLRTGENYLKLQPVISIILTRFDLLQGLPDLHNIFGIRAEKNPHVLLTDDLQIHTLELTEEKWTRFLKDHPLNAEQKRLQNWLDFLLNANKKSEGEMENLIMAADGLDVAYGKLQELSRDQELREIAFAQEKAERDREAELLFAQTAGLEKGIEKGIEKGLRKGLRQGRAEGEKTGMAKTLIANIQNVLHFRFGTTVPPELEGQIQTIQDPDLLQDLFACSLAADGLADVERKVREINR